MKICQVFTAYVGLRALPSKPQFLLQSYLRTCVSTIIRLYKSHAYVLDYSLKWAVQVGDASIFLY